MIRIATALGLAACLASPSKAQTRTAWTIEPGTRVRIHPWGGGGMITGSIDHLAFDTVFVALDKTRSRAVLFIELARINGLDVSAGHTSRLGPGAAVGTLFGAIVGFAWSSINSSSCDNNCSTGGMIIPLASLAGGGIGGLIGHLASGDRWVPVSLPPRAERKNPPFQAGFSEIR